ncbi:MAG TPA: phosphatidylglycerol lysyltransferase domain-containing protein [Desulfuromonadaceae bacterium]
MEIPAWPAARPLDFGDKPLLDGLFTRLQPRVSELTFAGLYLFRRAHDYQLTRVADSVVLLGKGYDGRRYFLPPMGGDTAGALEVMFDTGGELYGADEPFAERHLGGTGVEVTEDRNSFDYLYLREELATLPGNRFHKKKNRINYFTARHTYEVGIYEPHSRCGCLELLDTWYRMAEHEENASLDLELEATAEALSLAGQLGLEGVVVAVEGAVRAFALGERLNRETAVCHFEKADPFMEGLSQLVNREFSRLLFNDCRYINREQDLGEPGLRSAKLSYHPVELVKKYRARAK